LFFISLMLCISSVAQVISRIPVHDSYGNISQEQIWFNNVSICKDCDEAGGESYFEYNIQGYINKKVYPLTVYMQFDIDRNNGISINYDYKNKVAEEKEIERYQESEDHYKKQYILVTKIKDAIITIKEKGRIETYKGNLKWSDNSFNSKNIQGENSIAHFGVEYINKFGNDVYYSVSFDLEKKAKVLAVRNISQDTIKIKEKQKVILNQEPSFPNGEIELLRFISANLHYPVIAAEDGVQGKLEMRFNIEIDGSISNIEFCKYISPLGEKEDKKRIKKYKHYELNIESLKKEAIRVLKQMPKWEPKIENGVTVRSEYNIPITFKLE